MAALLPELDPANRTPLAELLASKGFTFSSIANLIPDCSVDLLARIATGRQPFPVDLAKSIGITIGIDLGTMLGTTRFWTPNAGPLTRQALPPDPLRGDPIPAFLGTATAPLVFPTPPPPEPQLWVTGSGLGAKVINRHTGAVIGTVAFTDVVDPVELAYDGTNIWTFGNGLSMGTSFDARIDPVSKTLVGESDANHTAFLGICFEPVTSTIWACSSTSTLLYRYNPGPVFFNPDAQIALVIGLNNFEPRDVIAFNGLLYATAVWPTGVPATPFEGRIFELDPVGFTILRSSTGTDLGNVLGIAVDDGGNLWTCSRSGGGTIGPMIAKTPISSLVSAQVPLLGDPGVLTDPEWIEFLFGSLWVSDATAPNGRLFEMDAGGNVLQSRTFVSGVAVGHVVGDGAFLWYSDKAGGLVHMLDPGSISGSAFTVAVGGSPDGLLVLG